MSSANSFLSSTTYHYNNSQSSSSSFNILSNTVQQQLNDLNSTRSSTSSCSTSHCLSNQCIECTTILSTRPTQTRCSYIEQSTNSSQFILTDNQTINDEQSSTRILSMNIPVDNTNENSLLNIDIEEDDEQHIDEQNEQLEVFVGFYRPGEYQREIMEDDDESDRSQKSDTQKKEEQV